jgi:hypothetical protein
MTPVIYSSDAYNALRSMTDFYGITLWKLVHHGTTLANTGRRTVFCPPPPWLLLFKSGPINYAKTLLNVVHTTMMAERADLDKTKKFAFHSKTGQLTEAFYDYLESIADVETKIDFVANYVFYIRGLIKKFPYPPLDGAPLLRTLKFKWFNEKQYVKNLRGLYGKNRTHKETTQDATLFFKLSLAEVVETMSLPRTRAACMLEIFRMELQAKP